MSPQAESAPETNIPFKMQLALQGGGAKLCILLAAMHAIQELQSQGLIQVTKISGTSAGSIVACLFAAGVDLAAPPGTEHSSSIASRQEIR